MERVSQFIISGNYFANGFITTLNGFAEKLESDIFIIVDGEEHNAKKLYSMVSRDPIKVGQTIKVVCYNNDTKKALSDLDKMREFIENDYRRTD